MNYIASTYISGIKDTQRMIIKLPDDHNYISSWYKSVISNNLKCIVFHNELSQDFIINYPECRFIKVINPGLNLYDFRWYMFKNLHDIDFDNIFLTDISDVELVKNPFLQTEYNQDDIFCGDEQYSMNTWPMLFADEKFKELPEWDNIINSGNVLLNAGIVGGSRSVVIHYIDLINIIIDQVKGYKETTCVDIPLYNYVLYRYFKPIHGFPVNSVFRKFEKSNDVWFIHK